MFGLVVLVWVDCVVAEYFSGGHVDDGDVGVFDEHDDACSAVFSADTEVSQFAGVAEGGFAVVIDSVDADAVVFAGGNIRW